MIPRANITAWRHHASWPANEQVEQDLVLSRALVEMFGQPVVAERDHPVAGLESGRDHDPVPYDLPERQAPDGGRRIGSDVDGRLAVAIDDPVALDGHDVTILSCRDRHLGQAGAVARPQQ